MQEVKLAEFAEVFVIHLLKIVIMTKQFLQVMQLGIHLILILLKKLKAKQQNNLQAVKLLFFLEMLLDRKLAQMKYLF